MLKNYPQGRSQEILNKIPIFLAKTFRIINNPEYDEIISWTTDGCSFMVKNISRLTNEVFPRHFKHTNFLSFVRQLNMYGFRKMRGQEEGAAIFHHECFQKHDLERLLLIKRRTLPIAQEAAQQQVVPVSRQERLEEEIGVLKRQHEDLQDMVQILMEQNKAITAQNKAFASMMANMKDKYRKKLETLMLLFLFGKKPKQQDGEFLFPPQFQNMLEAFDQLKNGANPLMLVPQQQRKKRNLKMITGPEFYSDIQRSQNGSQVDQSEKQDIFRVIKDLSDGQEQHKSLKRRKSQNSPFRRVNFDDDSHNQIPVSPVSIISRGNQRKLQQCQWDQYLDRLNRSESECSKLQLQQPE